jgi:hypothetical protein
LLIILDDRSQCNIAADEGIIVVRN